MRSGWRRVLATLAWVAAVVALPFAEARAVSLVNGDFETGDLTGWTVFTTANGTNGAGLPDVTLFDTNDDGTESNAATFNVGHIDNAGPAGGGGILQEVRLYTGSLQISADVAVMANDVFPNADGGLFELLLDGAVVDAHAFGRVSAGVDEFSMLADVGPVAAGLHTIALRITRPFVSSNLTPFQYVDDVVIGGSATLDPIPEPHAAALFGAGALIVAAQLRRRPRKEAAHRRPTRSEP